MYAKQGWSRKSFKSSDSLVPMRKQRTKNSNTTVFLYRSVAKTNERPGVLGDMPRYDLDMPGQKFHNGSEEHHKSSNIPKFRCEML